MSYRKSVLKLRREANRAAHAKGDPLRIALYHCETCNQPQEIYVFQLDLLKGTRWQWCLTCVGGIDCSRLKGGENEEN